MEIFCIVIVVFALFISVGAPYLAFLMCVIAFSILLFTKLDKKEEKALDFGQEWDYDTASQEYYRKQAETSKSHDTKMKIAATKFAAKHRSRVLSKIASGQRTVWLFSRYAKDCTFRRYLRQYLQCGELYNGLPFCLEVKVKDFVM